MNLIRNARYTALASAVAIVASCDSRLPTQSGTNALDDVDRPVVQFALSAGVNNTVDIGTPLTVSVTGTDNVGVSYMYTRVSNGAQVLRVDTASIQ